MSWLLKIPQHISLEVLRDWLGDHKDISNLDIACTSNQLIGVFQGNGFMWKRYLRHELLYLFWDPLFVLNQSVHVSAKNLTSYIQWLNTRQIRVRMIHLHIPKLKDLTPIKSLELPLVEKVKFHDHCKQHDIRLNDIKPVLAGCPCLTAIDCSAWCHITDDQLALIASVSTMKLKSLSLSGCFQLSDHGLTIVTNQFHDTLCELNIDCISITDQALRRIGSRCQSLRKVSLSYCILLTSAALKDFCASLPLLEGLSVEDFHVNQINDTILQEILQTNRAFRSLGLDHCKGITLASFPAILAACPEINSLVTRDYEYYSNATGIRQEHGRCRSNRRLKLKGCYTRQSTLQEMIQCCPVLVEALDAKECRKLSSSLLKAIVDKFGRILEKLEVSPWVDVANDAVVYALQNCPRLQSLSVDFCEGLGDETLMAIACHCPSLTSLSITKCPQVTDQGVLIMLDSCRSLQTLDVTACTALTDAILRKVSTHCTEIKQLSVLNTSVTKEGILRLMLENKVDLHKFFVDKKHAAWIEPQLAILKEFGMRWKKKVHFVNYFVDPAN